MCADINHTVQHQTKTTPVTSAYHQAQSSMNTTRRKNIAENSGTNEAKDEDAMQMLSTILSQTGGAGSLANMSKETLRRTFDPVMKTLENLDAEILLDLQRVPYGARLCDGVNVLPIHDQIVPRYPGSFVRYVHITEVPNQYRIGIFVFPPFSSIPLHDHPGMCVLSRLLYGDLQCFSLDLVRTPKDKIHHQNEDKQQKQNKKNLQPGSRLALKNDVVHLHAPAVTISYPYERNLHEFVAGPEGVAILDILLPPYSEENGRDCTFYDVYVDDEQRMNRKEERGCWVQPIDKPDGFQCLVGTYTNMFS